MEFKFWDRIELIKRVYDCLPKHSKGRFINLTSEGATCWWPNYSGWDIDCDTGKRRLRDPLIQFLLMSKKKSDGFWTVPLEHIKKIRRSK